MQIRSDWKKDDQTPDKPAGSYEWWYFDAVSEDAEKAVVVIFYEGIPFSPKYNQCIQNGDGTKAHPESYPAVSISVYDKGRPVWYSLTEFSKADASFGSQPLQVGIGPHRFSQQSEENRLSYHLTLNELLPNGDALEGELTFSSPITNRELLNEQSSGGHQWNLVQPAAEVTGVLSISGYHQDKIDFKGSGYHDHNYGSEPMKEAFRDWYWGRVHFPEATLVFYVMNQKSGRQYRGWLIDRENQQIISQFDPITTDEPQLNVFGLRPCRRIQLQSGDLKADIYQSRVVDNGPFYIRYLCDGVLHVPEWGIQKQKGISEYIYPSRIDRALFRPMVHMRYRYFDEKPHWVQKSPRLYRWTW